MRKNLFLIFLWIIFYQDLFKSRGILLLILKKERKKNGSHVIRALTEQVLFVSFLQVIWRLRFIRLSGYLFCFLVTGVLCVRPLINHIRLGYEAGPMKIHGNAFGSL